MRSSTRPFQAFFSSGQPNDVLCRTLSTSSARPGRAGRMSSEKRSNAAQFRTRSAWRNPIRGESYSPRRVLGPHSQ